MSEASVRGYQICINKRFTLGYEILKDELNRP
jgi:hypothetical protein